MNLQTGALDAKRNDAENSGGIFSGDYIALADHGDEGFGSVDLDSFGISDFQFDHLDSSQVDQGAQGLDLELTEAESAIVQFAERSLTGSRRRTAAEKSEKIYVTHEDFEEGPERDAFLLIYGYAENLFSGSGKGQFEHGDLVKNRAIDFFFCKTLGGLHLDDAINCIDTQIRVDVLRLRFMLEFWLRDWSLPEMPESADGLPGRIELMAADCGSIGIALAKTAWFQPGIDAKELLEMVSEGDGPVIQEKVKQAFKKLVCDYVLSISNGKVYTTGKNPILELQDKVNDPEVRVRGRLANIYWSRKF